MTKPLKRLFSMKSLLDNYRSLTIITAFLLSPILLLAQAAQPPHYDSTRNLQPSNADGFYWTGTGKFGGALIIPLDTFKLAHRDSGAIAYKGRKLWCFNGSNWNQFSGSSTGSNVGDSLIRLFDSIANHTQRMDTIPKYLRSTDGSVVFTQIADTIDLKVVRDTGVSLINTGNYFVSAASVTTVDSTVTVGQPIVYVQYGIIHTETTSHGFTVNTEPAGTYRTDAIYIDFDGSFHIVSGIPDTIITSPPVIPAGAILVSYVNIFGSTLSGGLTNTGVNFWRQGGDTTLNPFIGSKNNVPLGFLINNIQRGFWGTNGWFNLSPIATGVSQGSNPVVYNGTNSLGNPTQVHTKSDGEGSFYIQAPQEIIAESATGTYTFLNNPSFTLLGKATLKTNVTTGNAYTFWNSYHQNYGSLLTIAGSSLSGFQKDFWRFNYNGALVGCDSCTTSADSSAILELRSTIKAFLPPRMTAVQMQAIPTPGTGSLVFNTTDSSLYEYRGLSGWSSFRSGSGGTLQSVTDAGSTTTNPINIGGLIIPSLASSGYNLSTDGAGNVYTTPPPVTESLDETLDAGNFGHNKKIELFTNPPNIGGKEVELDGVGGKLTLRNNIPTITAIYSANGIERIDQNNTFTYPPYLAINTTYNFPFIFRSGGTTAVANDSGIVDIPAGVTGGGINYVIQSSAPSDTTKLWMDNSKGAKGVWPIKQRLIGTWVTVRWYDPVAKLVRVKRPKYGLVSGQSNATWRTGGGDTARDGRVLYFATGGSWGIAAPVSTGANNIGYQACKNIAKYEDEIVRFVVVAEVSKPLSDWLPGGAKTIEIGNIAREAGIDSFDFVIFRQGERDAELFVTESQYAARMDSVFNAYRDSSWFGKSCKVFAGGMNEAYYNTGPFDYYYKLNNGDRGAMGITAVSTLGLSQAGGIHQDGRTIDTVGYRYYRAWQGMATQYSLEKNPNTNWLTGNQLGIANYSSNPSGIRLQNSVALGLRGGYLKYDALTGNVSLGVNPVNNGTLSQDSAAININGLSNVGIGGINNLLTTNRSKLLITSDLPMAVSIVDKRGNIVYQIDTAGYNEKPIKAYNVSYTGGEIILAHSGAGFENGRIRMTRGGSLTAESYNGPYIHHNGLTNLLWFGVHPSTDTISASDINVFNIGNNGRGVAIKKTTEATAYLEIGASLGAANTMPIKYNSGSLVGTIVAGGGEYNGVHYESNSATNRYAKGGNITDFFNDANNTSTTETDLFTYTTKASTLNAAGQKLIFEMTGLFNDATATAQLQFYFGGTNIGNTGALTVSATGAWYAEVKIIRNGASTAKASVTVTSPGTTAKEQIFQTDLTGLTFTGTNIIKVTGTAGGAGGGTNDITAKLGSIFWYGESNN